MDHEESIKYINMPEHLKGKYQYFTQSANDKLKKALPDMTYMTLEEAVEDYTKNYLEPQKYLGD